MQTNNQIIFKEIRQNQILEILKKKKTVTVNHLVKTLYASHATIRRDLDAMEKFGLIKRVHGGAMLIDSTSIEAAQELREYENSDKKIIIAHLLEPFMSNNKSIFIDSSTTNRFLMPVLKNFTNNTYITNSIKTVQELLSNNIDGSIQLAGGSVVQNSNNTNGILTVEFLNNFITDISLIACRGVSTQFGCTVVSSDQAIIKKTMIKNSTTSFLLCDSTKFETNYLVKFADFSDFDYFITDKIPNEELYNKIIQSGCKIITNTKEK